MLEKATPEEINAQELTEVALNSLEVGGTLGVDGLLARSPNSAFSFFGGRVPLLK